MWKRLQNTVGVGRKSSSKPSVRGANDTPPETKETKSVKKNKNKDPPAAPSKKKNEEEDYDTEEMRDVLKLFNKLEELVVEGDPRVRQVLDRRPLVQQALMEEGNVTDRSDFSPRPTIPKLQIGSPREPTFVREESGVSGQPTMYKDKQLTVSDLGVRSPRQVRYTQDRYHSNNAIVYNQTIPEQAVLQNTYQINNYQGGRVRKHPDGTLLTTTNGPTIYDGHVNEVNPSFTRSIPQAARSQPPQRIIRNPAPRQEAVVPKLDLHEFNYETPRGKSQVQVHLRADDKTHNFNYTNPDAGYQVRVSLDNLPQANTNLEAQQNPDITMEASQAQPPAITQNVGLPAPIKREPVFAKRKNNPNWTDITSKVLTSDGGDIICSGCKVSVPKNAVPNKALIRMSVMDIQEVPFASSAAVTSERFPDLLPVSAAISIEPQNLLLQKPVTVRLQTSIAKRNQDGAVLEAGKKKKEKERLKGTEGDIEAKDIIIQHRNTYTSDIWQKMETQVFRSSDSVMFRTQELGNFCAFLARSGRELLIKKIAVYIFQSLERRKKQFLSVLVCEDQPHVLQKGIETMPGWLHYMDSCFNVAMEEGRNLIVYLEPKDRALCSIDVNKMEIPWENLWRPECIIRKHFIVTLHKLDVEAPMQLMVNEANYSMTTAFMWQIQRKAIFLPDPVPVENYTLDQERTQDELERMDEPRQKEYSSLYKHVTWKPETPDVAPVTNESLLRYATM